MFRSVQKRVRRTKKLDTQPVEVDLEGRIVLQDFVDTIVQELGFVAAMLAVIEHIGGETRLTVKAFATRYDGDRDREFSILGFVSRSLLDIGERIAGQPLLENYVRVDAETEQVNDAVKVIRQEKEYEIVDDLYRLFAPRVSPEIAGLLQRVAGVRQIVTVPFRNRDGRVIGNLYAGSEARDITAERIRQIRAFARLTTTVIENLSLRRERIRITGRETVLKETITDMLYETLSEHRLLRNIASAVVHKLGYRACMLMVVHAHEDKQLLLLEAYEFVSELLEELRGAEVQVDQRLRRGIWVPVNAETAEHNIGVRAILQEQPHLVSQRLDELFFPALPASTGATLSASGIRSIVSVPLRTRGGDLRGNLYALSDQDVLNEGEIDDLKTFALAASIAIENAQRVRQTQRMGLLVSGMGHLTHRFKNLLGGARWDVEWLLYLVDNKQVQPEQLPVLLRQVREHISHSIELVNGLKRRFTESIDSESVVDVNGVLHEALQALSTDYHFKRPLTVHVHEMYCAEKPFARAASDLLREAFMILLKNAFEAMGDVGSLSITTEIMPANTSQQDRTVRVCIRDSGPGIPVMLRNDLFMPMRSTKERGMGFGLWLAWLTVKGFNGEINLDTVTAEEIRAFPHYAGRDSGTTFMIDLPIIEIEDRSGTL